MVKKQNTTKELTSNKSSGIVVIFYVVRLKRQIIETLYYR